MPLIIPSERYMAVKRKGERYKRRLQLAEDTLDEVIIYAQRKYPELTDLIELVNQRYFFKYPEGEMKP